MEPLKINVEVSLSEDTLSRLTALFGLTPAKPEEPKKPTAPKAAAPEPVEEERILTEEDVRKAAKEIRPLLGSAAPIKALLQEFGVEAVSALPQKHYTEFVQKLKALVNNA